MWGCGGGTGRNIAAVEVIQARPQQLRQGSVAPRLVVGAMGERAAGTPWLVRWQAWTVRRPACRSVPSTRQADDVPTRANRPDAPGVCFVCGLDCARYSEDPPWGESGLDPSYNFCPCCGVEFGYGDFSIEAARSWRARWPDRGYTWQVTDLRPEEWNPRDQLAQLPERAR
jgi:hypothetical protein